MKPFFVILLLCVTGIATGQSAETEPKQTITRFHQALVSRDYAFLRQHLDSNVSYGHSNGWVETREEMIKNLETGVIIYHQVTEDSLQLVTTGELAHVRFVTDIKANLRGKESVFHLRVLEVWARKNDRWILFARQAIK